MTKFMAGYIRKIETMNYWIGRFAMYLIFLMVGVLLWSSITKTLPFMRPSLWTLEMAQFIMVAYYVLGGPYSIQLRANVRMDLVYGNFSLRKKAFIDCFTILFLITYIGFLIYGGTNSLLYALEYGERSASAWRPYIWPIKLTMLVGFILMLLQAIAELFKDIERVRSGDEHPFGIVTGNGESV